MEYIVDDKKYSLSYQELKEHYLNFVSMSDAEFIININKALHLACIISFLKETPSYILLCDTGLIHEMVHYLNEDTRPTIDIQKIRELFNFWLKLD